MEIVTGQLPRPTNAAAVALDSARFRHSYAYGRCWPDEEDVENTGERCATSGGYSLHANTCVKANERERLKKLIQYMARPALSDDRIEIVVNRGTKTQIFSVLCTLRVTVAAAVFDRRSRSKLQLSL